MKLEKNAKLALDQLKVHSFVTHLEKLKGGTHLSDIRICPPTSLPPFQC